MNPLKAHKDVLRRRVEIVQPPKNVTHPRQIVIPLLAHLDSGTIVEFGSPVLMQETHRPGNLMQHPAKVPGNQPAIRPRAFARRSSMLGLSIVSQSISAGAETRAVLRVSIFELP